ncbi:hypothetical protein U1Q18_005160 [Sarracenia purpurea var. burkii]
MVRPRMKLPGFCMNGGAGRVRVISTAHAQLQQSKRGGAYNSICAAKKAEIFRNVTEMGIVCEPLMKPESEGGGNRVMVVVESRLEAATKAALKWALSHSVQSQDTIVLLHVTKFSSKQGANSSIQKAYGLLYSMKDICQMRRPGVQVEIAVVEGKEKEKGPTIVEEAKQQRATLLVLGQEKRSMAGRLQKMMWWRGEKSQRSTVVEHCIHNASCMVAAVRRKSSKYGGYLITTKRHKNFWLLA